MSEQEWTPETANKGDSPERFEYLIKALADAYKAVLAAEREKADNLFKVSRKHCVENQELRQQLAADKKLFVDLILSLNNLLWQEYQGCRGQSRREGTDVCLQ